MPWEHIGSCGGGQMPDDRAWILFCYETAISYLDFVLGDPPKGCSVDIMWHDHDYGEYPSVGVHWDHPQTDPPWKYIRQCETALRRFDQAVSWFDISPSEIEAELESEFEETEEPDSENWSITEAMTQPSKPSPGICVAIVRERFDSAGKRISFERSHGIIRSVDERGYFVDLGGNRAGQEYLIPLSGELRRLPGGHFHFEESDEWVAPLFMYTETDRATS